jgi:hypothetical protein
MLSFYKLYPIVLFLHICNFSFSQSSEFVRLQGNEFTKGGETIFMLTANYGVQPVHNSEGEYFVRPLRQYSISDTPRCSTKTSCDIQIKIDLIQIKDMGFNSIRLFGNSFGNNPPTIISRHYNSWSSSVSIPLTEPYSELISGIQQVLDIASLPDVDLKVQLLAGGKELGIQSVSDAYEDYLGYLANHFGNDPTIYAYDLVNEPEYNYPSLDALNRFEVCNHVSKWHKAVKDNCAFQSTTIGLYGSKSVRRFNPGLIGVDFNSLHVYPKILESEGVNKQQKALDRVRSEIKWLSDALSTPWVIGEIGFSSNDEVAIPYIDTMPHGDFQDQANFAEATLNMVRDCGGIGYSWWQFHDSPEWGSTPRSDHMGLISMDETYKPAVSVFQNFDSNGQSNSCVKPWGYHNFYGSSIANKSGYVYDTIGDPIEHAVIEGWGVDGVRYSTFSRDDGFYRLYFDAALTNFKISAVGASLTEQNNLIQIYYLNVFEPSRDLYVSGITVSEGSTNYDIQASNTIHASNITIEGNDLIGGKSSMKATTVVYLGTDFSAQRGCHFHAYNASVFPTCNAIDNYYKNLVSIDSSQISDPNILIQNKEVFGFQKGSVTLFPNPNNGLFKVSTMESELIRHIEVFNNLGQMLYRFEPKSSFYNVDIRNQEKGFYIVKIYTNEGITSFRVIYK